MITSTASSTESSPPKVSLKSASPQATSGAGLVFYNSATAQVASCCTATPQVLPVHLVSSGAVSVAPVPLLHGCVYPIAVGNPALMHAPWLAAPAAGTQVCIAI